jgi:hypothetical protein
MLVNDKPFELVGYLSAVDDGPGFVVPLFMTRKSNRLLVQEVGDDDAVHNFREVEPSNFHRLYGSDQFLALGEQALWGFHMGDTRPLIMERAPLRERLLSILRILDRPFLKLQVAQFCDDQDEVIDAWRTAFEHLEQRSPRSAQAWRDVVVIPTQMRLAVESAVIANGLDASTKHLNRTVEVDVEHNQVRLRLERDLYGALTSHAAAMSSLERNAAPIREAFRLAPNRLMLLSHEAGTKEEVEEETSNDDFAIAGFGSMALSVIAQVFPRIRRSRDGLTSHLLGPPREYGARALLQREEISGIKHWGDQDALPKLSPQNRVLLVLCQFGPEHTILLDDATQFASAHRSQRRTVVAVIPHLPQEFEEPGELARSVMPALHRAFDTVWALSDRSPYTRQSLPYGPGRSVQAAATHLRYLIRMSQDERLRDHLLSERRYSSGINVVGSATGDKPTTKLVEHAMLRLRHHMFDVRPVTSARIQSSGREETFDGIVREIVHRDAPEAAVKIFTTPKGDGGPDHVLISLKNVALLAGGEEEFERYCVGQLEQFGWGVDQFEPNGLVHVTYGGFESLPTECRYVAAGSLESVLRTRRRRQRLDDGILLTNAVIRRRTFALHVVNGAVPVHCSRVEALYRIYRRRYAYALTYFRQETKAAERIILPAAIDWLNLHHWFDTKNVGRASMAPEERPAIDFGPSGIALSLVLEVTRGRGVRKSTTSGRADIVLNETGWHLLRLGIADEWVHGA